MKHLVILLIIFSATYCFGQTYMYDGQGNIIGGNHISTSPGESVKITDSITNGYFVLDSTHTIIEGFEINGKSIWKINPHKDNKLDNYRTDKPYIVYFKLVKDHWCSDGFVKKGEYVIAISFVNTQFGLIDINSGKFRFCGQD